MPHQILFLQGCKRKKIYHCSPIHFTKHCSKFRKSFAHLKSLIISRAKRRYEFFSIFKQLNLKRYPLSLKILHFNQQIHSKQDSIKKPLPTSDKNYIRHDVIASAISFFFSLKSFRKKSYCKNCNQTNPSNRTLPSMSIFLQHEKLLFTFCHLDIC